MREVWEDHKECDLERRSCKQPGRQQPGTSIGRKEWQPARHHQDGDIHNSLHTAWSLNVTGEFRDTELCLSSLHVSETHVQERLPSGTFGVKYLKSPGKLPNFLLEYRALQLAFCWQNSTGVHSHILFVMQILKFAKIVGDTEKEMHT